MGYIADNFPLTIPSGGHGMCIERIARNNPTYIRTTGTLSRAAIYEESEVKGLDNNDAALLGLSANNTITVVRDGVSYPITAKDIVSTATGVRTTSITSTAFSEPYQLVTQAGVPVVFALFSDFGVTQSGTGDVVSNGPSTTILNFQFTGGTGDRNDYNLPFEDETALRAIYVRPGNVGPLIFVATVNNTTDQNGQQHRVRANIMPGQTVASFDFINPGDAVYASLAFGAGTPTTATIEEDEFGVVEGADITVNFTYVVDASINTQMSHNTPPGVTIQAFSNTGRTTAVTNAVIINNAPNRTGDI